MADLFVAITKMWKYFQYEITEHVKVVRQFFM